MSGAAHRVNHIGLAFDADGFLARHKSLPAVWGLVLQGVGRVDFFQIQVLHIRAGIGETPSHMAVVAQDHQRHAWQSGTDDVLFR